MYRLAACIDAVDGISAGTIGDTRYTTAGDSYPCRHGCVGNAVPDRSCNVTGLESFNMANVQVDLIAELRCEQKGNIKGCLVGSANRQSLRVDRPSCCSIVVRPVAAGTGPCRSVGRPLDGDSVTTGERGLHIFRKVHGDVGIAHR